MRKKLKVDKSENSANDLIVEIDREIVLWPGDINGESGMHETGDNLEVRVIARGNENDEIVINFPDLDKGSIEDKINASGEYEQIFISVVT